MFMCRLCLKETDHLQNIINSQLKCAEWTLVESIYWIFGVKVDVNDPHTKFICERCESAIRCIGKYRDLYKKNQLVLESRLKSKNHELTNQTATPLKCTIATQTTPLAISSPKAKKRRLTMIDYYYKTPTMAIRELVHRKTGNACRKEKSGKNEGTEEPLVQVQEVEVKVCKYCSETFNTKRHLEIHCISQHGSLHVRNRLRKAGRRKKHRKGKNKKEQLQMVLSRMKDPGRVSKNKFTEAFSFPNLNFMKELDLRENNLDIGKINASEITGLAEDIDSTLPIDSSTPKCSEIEIKTISIKGLLGNKEDIVKILNKRHAWLNLKDFSIPLNRDTSTTNEIDCTEAEEESNSLDKSTDIRCWKNNLSGTLQTLSLIKKSAAMKQWMKISTVTEENEEIDSENDDAGGFEGITGIGETNSSDDDDNEESLEVQNSSKPLPEESNPLDKSSHASVGPDVRNWKNNLSDTLQTLSLINQSNNMWTTVTEENQETDSENDNAGGIEGTTGIRETNSSEDGDNEDSPEVQDASKSLPESTNKAEEELNPLDESRHAIVGPEIQNWRNSLSDTLQILSLINQSNNMWTTVTEENQETDSENDNAGGIEGTTGIRETNSSEDGDNEDSPEVQDASKSLPESTTKAEEELNPLDKSRHANVGPEIQNWRNSLSDTLQTLSLINQSGSMNQWMKISTVTQDNQETDSENDDAGGFEGITGIGETNSSDDGDNEESLEVPNFSKPLPEESNPLDKSSHASVGPDVRNWKNNLSDTLQTLSLINQSNNMWTTVTEENQETDSENDNAGGIEGTTGIRETNSSEDGDNEDSPEVQDASKSLPESTTKAEEELNPLDKSRHANVGPEIQNWRNSLSDTLQTLSLINQSGSMNQWMKISTVTQDNQETDSENDNAGGIEGTTGIGETNSSEDGDTEESPEVQDAAEPLTDTQLALEREGPEKTIPNSQQKKKTDEVAQEGPSTTTQQSKNVEKVEVGDSDSTKTVVKELQVQKTQGKQKDVSKNDNKMTEMQNMKEHILSTLRKIKEIKERTAMNQRGRILQTEKEQTNNDSKIAETETTMEDVPAVAVQDKGEIPQNSDESEEEAAENTWEEDRDSLSETDLGTSNLDETVIADEKIIHVAAVDIIYAPQSEPVAIKQERLDQTSAPEHLLTANANERVEWKKNISFTKLQQINTIRVLEKSTGSQELGSEDDTLSGTEFILPDNNFDEDSEHDVGREEIIEIDEAGAENATEDAPAVTVQENSQKSTEESEEDGAENTWEEHRDSLSKTEVTDLSTSNLDETTIIVANDIINAPESEPVAIRHEPQDHTSAPEHPLTANANERVEWKKNISSSLMKLQQINTIEVLEKSTGSEELGSKDDMLSNASEFILPDHSALEHHIKANANERIEWKKNISVSLTKLQQIKTFEVLQKSTGSQEFGSKDDTLSNSSEFILPDDNFDEDSEHDVAGEEDIEIDEDISEEDADKHDTVSINEELSLLNGKELVVSIERCPIEPYQNCETSEKCSQTAAYKKWKNRIPETLLKLKKAVIVTDDLLENEDMMEDSDSENEILINYLNRSTKGIKTITVNQNCLSEDDQTILNTLNNQHSWLNLKEFCISVKSCKVPSEVRQSIVAERNKCKESISTLLPKMKELKENYIMKEKMESVKTRVHVERSNEPEFVVDTNDNEGGEIATTILTDCERDSRDPLRDEDAENNDQEVAVTVSLSNSSGIANNIKQLPLKDFHIPLERIDEPTNVKDVFGLRYWKGNVSKTVLKTQSIKEVALEEDKSKLSDVKPIATRSKKIIKLDHIKLKDNAPTTDDMYELVVDPNSLEFEAQVISINNNPEDNNHSQNTQEKIDSAVTVQQDIILNRSLTQDAEEIPSLTEDLIENNLPVTNCIIETIDIGPQDSPEIEDSRANQELSANQEECDNQCQPLGDILEQASIWIQQNTEDTDGIEQGRKTSLVQIEDLVQNQENEAVPNQKSQVPTEKVVHETYEDLVASLEIEGASTPPITEKNIQDKEINTNDVPSEQIDAFDSENEINNEADRQTYEALVKSLETETESQTHTEQTYPVQLPTENVSQKQKTSVQTEDERHEAKTPEREVKNKKQPATEDTKSEPQSHSPKMKHSATSEPADPKSTGHKSNFKKKTKKEKSRVPCCPHHRPDLILKAGERVPSTSLIMDHNPVQNTDSEENKAHGSKSDGKPSKQRKKSKNITLMNETDRLTRDVEQLTKYLNLLKLMEDNQKCLSSSGGKLPSSPRCDDPVKKTSDKRQETANKEEDLAKGRTTDSTERNPTSPKTNEKNTSTLKDQGRKENNTNNAVSDKRAEEIKMWRAHLNSTLSKIKQIQASKLFTSKMDAATKILPNKECEKDDVTET